MHALDTADFPRRERLQHQEFLQNLADRGGFYLKFPL
jgi:hypothetical protein